MPIQPFDWKTALATGKKNYKVQQLEAQLAGTRARLQAQGQSVPSPKGHPSILSRIMDVISRGNYAMANTFDRPAVIAQQHGGHFGSLADRLGNMGSGFVRGLEGKDKVRFSNVMQDMVKAGAATGPFAIEKNKFVQGIGGLAADVTTDPLAYVGGSITHAAPDIEGVAAAGQAIRGAQSGKTTTQALMDAAEAAHEATKAAKRGTIGLEVLGHPVAESEKLYEGLAKVGRPLLHSPVGETLNKGFRTAATFPGRLKTALTVNRQANVASYTDLRNFIMDNLGGLTREEGAKVSHAIEKGVDLTGVVGKNGHDLGAAQQFYRDQKATWEQIERAHGLRLKGTGIDNYVPHYLPKAENETDAAKEFDKLARRHTAHVASGQLKGAPKAALPTLENLKDAGLHPHENIVDAMQLRAAEHSRAIAKAAFHNDVIDNYGVEFGGKGAQKAKDAAEASGLVKLTHEDVPTLGKREVYVPQQARDAIRSLNRYYLSDTETAKITKMFDQFQRLWKTGVTTINPAHHIRNAASDLFQAWEAGVENPADLTRGLRVLREEGTVSLPAKTGTKAWDANDISRLYKEKGASSGFYNTDLVGATTPGAFTENVSAPLNQGMEWLRNKVAQRENFVRMTTFVHALKEEGTKMGGIETFADLNKAAEKAADTVRKFHFDYSDLTPFEGKLRRAIPFYTFMRKNIPLQLEMLMLHPGKISQVPKGFAAIQSLLGTDPQHLPVTEHIPAYMRDVFNLRIRGETPGHNAAYMGVPLPLEDLSRTFTGSTADVVRKIVAQTTPAIRAPVEIGTKTSLTSGAPLHGSIGQYAVNQLPWSRFIAQSIHPPVPNRVIQPGEQTTQRFTTELINQLTGAGLKEITPQMQLSELRRQQTPLQAQLRSLRTKRTNAALRKAKR